MGGGGGTERLRTVPAQPCHHPKGWPLAARPPARLQSARFSARSGDRALELRRSGLSESSSRFPARSVETRAPRSVRRRRLACGCRGLGRPRPPRRPRRLYRRSGGLRQKKAGTPPRLSLRVADRIAGHGAPPPPPMPPPPLLARPLLYPPAAPTRPNRAQARPPSLAIDSESAL